MNKRIVSIVLCVLVLIVLTAIGALGTQLLLGDITNQAFSLLVFILGAAGLAFLLFGSSSLNKKIWGSDKLLKFAGMALTAVLAVVILLALWNAIFPQSFQAFRESGPVRFASAWIGQKDIQSHREAALREIDRMVTYGVITADRAGLYNPVDPSRGDAPWGTTRAILIKGQRVASASPILPLISAGDNGTDSLVEVYLPDELGEFIRPRVKGQIVAGKIEWKGTLSENESTTRSTNQGFPLWFWAFAVVLGGAAIAAFVNKGWKKGLFPATLAIGGIVFLAAFVQVSDAQPNDRYSGAYAIKAEQAQPVKRMVQVDFVNRRNDEAHIYLRYANGVCAYYGTVPAGQIWNQPTYTNNSWEVRTGLPPDGAVFEAEAPCNELGDLLQAVKNPRMDTTANIY